MWLHPSVHLCGFLVHHFMGTGLRCAPPTCVPTYTLVYYFCLLIYQLPSHSAVVKFGNWRPKKEVLSLTSSMREVLHHPGVLILLLLSTKLNSQQWRFVGTACHVQIFIICCVQLWKHCNVKISWWQRDPLPPPQIFQICTALHVIQPQLLHVKMCWMKLHPAIHYTLCVWEQPLHSGLNLRSTHISSTCVHHLFNKCLLHYSYSHVCLSNGL